MKIFKPIEYRIVTSPWFSRVIEVRYSYLPFFIRISTERYTNLRDQMSHASYSQFHSGYTIEDIEEKAKEWFARGPNENVVSDRKKF